MSKVTLSNVSTLQNSSIVSTINSNNSTLTTAFENTLSRDGTLPNAMGSDLDMNSYQILNLPSPSTSSSPVRLQDVTNNIAIPVTAINPYPVVNANNFVGATAGDQIVAALATLPASGGTVDARSLTNRVINGFTISSSNTTILFPPGEFTMNGSILITKAGGIQCVNLQGAGASDIPNGTGFSWTGGNLPNTGVIVLSGCRDCYLSDFYVRGSNSFTINGIQQQSLTGAGSTNNRYRNIHMFGAGAGGLTIGLQKGWRWCTGTQAGGSGPDNNNDFSNLEKCYVQSFGQTAYSIEHGQAKCQYFQDCLFNGGQIGVDSLGGYVGSTFSGGGSFKWFGGGGGSCTDADFAIVENDFCVINGISTENSNRMVRSAGLSIPFPLVISNCRFAANLLNVDNKVIVSNAQAGCTVIGLEVDSTITGRTPLLFQTDTSGGTRPAGSVAIGCSLVWATVAAPPPNPLVGNWVSIGNWVIANDTSVPYRIPDVNQPGVPTTVTNATYSQTNVESSIIANRAGTVTLTLLSPITFPGKILDVRTIQAQTVVSATSNVVPIVGGAATTAILAATAGKWARLQSDGTNWQIMASN